MHYTQRQLAILGVMIFAVQEKEEVIGGQMCPWDAVFGSDAGRVRILGHADAHIGAHRDGSLSCARMLVGSECHIHAAVEVVRDRLNWSSVECVRRVVWR